jgi:hypothetical protein
MSQDGVRELGCLTSVNPASCETTTQVRDGSLGLNGLGIMMGPAAKRIELRVSGARVNSARRLICLAPLDPQPATSRIRTGFPRLPESHRIGLDAGSGQWFSRRRKSNGRGFGTCLAGARDPGRGNFAVPKVEAFANGAELRDFQTAGNYWASGRVVDYWLV